MKRDSLPGSSGPMPGAALPPIVFSHANGFPAGTYSLLLDELRVRGFRVHALSRFGHDPAYPVTDGWGELVRQLADFVHQKKKGDAVPSPVLVGHSLGGMLSLMCAALHPELASAVILLDALPVTGWRALGLRAAKRMGWMPRVSPSGASRRRRQSWDSLDAAVAHFGSKAMFQRWHPRMLHDYLACGTRAQDGARVLAFEREVETRIYETLPHNLGALLRAHPLRCPVVVLGGLQSHEMRQLGGLRAAARCSDGRLTMLPGSHLFPMELPLATAAAIEAQVRALRLDRHAVAVGAAWKSVTASADSA